MAHRGPARESFGWPNTSRAPQQRRVQLASRNPPRGVRSTRGTWRAHGAHMHFQIRLGLLATLTFFSCNPVLDAGDDSAQLEQGVVSVNRLYFPSTGTAPISPAFSSAWGISATERRPLALSKNGDPTSTRQAGETSA